MVTLFGTLPLYTRVAEVIPNGQGSIAMLEKLFPKWGGKASVLLGFASTDFIIAMTLSAADRYFEAEQSMEAEPQQK